MNKKELAKEIGLRVKTAREKKNITQQELAELLGYKSKSSVTHIENGRDIPRSMIVKLSDILDVTPAYLMGWESDDKNDTNDIPNPNLTLETPYHVPIFNSVSAGFGAYASSDIVGYMPMVIANPHDIKDTICIKVKGDSMYPKIEDGDVITVRKQATVDNGQIAVVRIGDECVVKKVELGKNFLKMVSINPEYKDRILTGPELEGVEIVGLVQQVTKKL